MTTERRRQTSDVRPAPPGWLIPRSFTLGERVKLSLELDELEFGETGVVLRVKDGLVLLDAEEAVEVGQYLLALATAADWDENFQEEEK